MVPQEARTPQDARSQYNRLLLDIDARLMRHDKINESMRLPAPLALDGPRAQTELEKHMALHCNVAARDEALELARQRIASFNHEQCALFWHMFRRIRAYCQGEDNAAKKALGDWHNPRCPLQVRAGHDAPKRFQSMHVTFTVKRPCTCRCPSSTGDPRKGRATSSSWRHAAAVGRRM